jgi:adenylate cyclase
MADIFISYSRKDSGYALEFADKLRSSGRSIWIDQHGIEGASSWSGEIVRAINQCTAFIVLLSRASIESDNVVREIALAFEKKKKILPIELESVTLPESMAYPLAGIQKLAHTNWDAIDRVLSKLIVAPDVPTAEPILELPKDSLGRKSIAVLPIENLSSDPDNEWFADGLTQEIIGLLSKMSSLYVIDRRSVMVYKNTKKTMKVIAQELGVEYILEGTVRKAGPNLRIACELVEAVSGKHIWSETFKGTIDDIFEIQESVAKNIADGLDIVLNPKERSALQTLPTTNVEAYELYLRSREYGYSKNERDAIPLLVRVIELDPNFVLGYTNLSSIYLRARDTDPTYLSKAHDLALKAYTLDPTSPASNIALGSVLFTEGKVENAYGYLRTAYDKDPNMIGANAWLGFYYRHLQKYPEAAKYYERALELEPGQPHFVMHLIGIYSFMNDTAALRDLALRTLPYIELRMRSNPDHEAVEMVFVSLLPYADRFDEVMPTIKKLDLQSIERPIEIFNFACIVAPRLPSFAIELLQLAITKGFSDLQLLRTDTDLDPLRGLPEFEELMRDLEEKISKEKNG